MKKITVNQKGKNSPPKKRNPMLSLTICVMIDLIGFTSYIIPALGEFSDIVIAPLTAAGIYWLFYKENPKLAKIGAIIGGIEEALPLTDFLPTATILWMIQNKDQLIQKE